MAAAPGLLLWLLLLGPLWWVPGQPDPSPGRRFSDLKVCADEECSMLMYRGAAVADFTGPDCRFVNFKKGDHVYVYYKLAGGSPEVWAGSVGRVFGYFPKDLIKVLHKYTEEELQVPADETDFVCFEGGRDDFDNYNVEELLGSLELDDSASDESEKAKEVSQHEVKSPEGAQETELDPTPEPEPVKADSGEREGAFSESTEELQEQPSAQESHPHATSAADNAQGRQSSVDNFEEMLHDKLKVPGSENRTSNSSPVSVEQEKIDAYKVLKTEMTLDLKTKFGSTADALVSDDEATRLVTSLEDDFDEELDAEYYPMENEEEENVDNFDELPLLSFADEEDEKVPGKPGMEKYSIDKDPNLSEEDKVEPTLPPGIQSDNKDLLTTWGDTLFSIVTGGEGKTGEVGLESSNPEEDKREDVLVSASRERKPQSTAGYMDPEDEEDDLFVEVSKTNGEKDSETDQDLVITGEEKPMQDSRRGLAHHESKSEVAESETVSAYQPQSSKLNPLPAAEKGKEFTLKAVFEKKENGLKEPVIHISKETPHEEKTGGGLERESVPRAVVSPGTENSSKHESLGATPLLGDHQPDASKDSMEVAGASVSGPKVDQQEGFQNQPGFSSPEETALSRELREKVPTLGRNLSWQQQERDVAVVEGREDPADVEPPHPQAIQGIQEADSREVPSVQIQRPEAEEDDYPTEELLEDENAVSAQQSKENHPRVQDRKSDMNSQVFEKVILGTLNLDTEENKQAANMIVETGKKSKTTSEGADGTGKESGSVVVDKEKSHLAAVRAQGPAEVDGLHEKMPAHTAGFGEAIQSKDPDALQKDNPEELVNTFQLGEIPGGEETSEGEPEDPEEFGGSERQVPDAEDLGDGSPQQAPPEIPDIVLKSVREDLPIINSFFKDQKSLYRFLKYFDVHELEGMLQDMSIRLKSAHRDSLPYNVEKVLDKVFRASESRILSVAENMLDNRVTKNRDLGTQENSLLEEAAVLDDVQDLIYFVRYQHSGVETAPLATPPPQEEGGAGPIEEVQPLQQDSLPQENTGDLSVQLPEEPAGLLDQPVTGVQLPEEPAGLLDQPVTGVQHPEEPAGLLDQPVTGVQHPEEPGLLDQPVTGVQLPEQSGLLDQPVTGHMSASEVLQKPNTEKDIDPDFLVTKVSPVGAGDAEKHLETRAEEPDNISLLENTLGSLYSFILYLSKMLIATLPDNVQPGPDFYGLPWQPVIATAVLGIVSFAIFSWRTMLVVKSRVYQVTEKQISEKLETIKKENAELMQKLSNYEQKIKESKKYVQETKKQNVILSDDAIKYKDKIRVLEETNEILGDKAKSLHLMLESEREQNVKNQGLILENKKSIEKLKDVISMNASELSEVQIALNEAKLSEENVKSECHRVQEENARLKKKKEQLQQQIEEWSKSHAELTEQIKSFERSQKDLEVALTHKDDNIDALTNCITQLNRVECELESEDQSEGGNESDELANGEVGGDRSEKRKHRVEQMMDISRTQTAVSIVEEDLKLLQLKLRTSMSTKCNLEGQIKKLEDDCSSLQTAKAGLEDECKTLRQKVEILNELYQQKEMALQKKLSQEEYERQDREQRLSAADGNVVLAAEEVKTYKRRIEEMEEELQKTEQSFKSQIAAHEKKAHENWLKARAAERAMEEEKREAANLRHKLLEITQKMAMRQDEPVIVKPIPGRPNTQNPPRRGLLSQNGSFGPSPVSGGECSPPLPAEPPGRPLSATLSRRDMPRSECGSLDRHLPSPRWSSEASGKHAASDPGPAPVVNSSSRSSSPAKATDEGKVNMAPKGPPPFPGVPLLGAPLGGPMPPPIRYGPPPQLCGPFGSRPLPPPPPFVPGMHPPLGIREYAPGVLPGKRDLPVDPREFLPGHIPFRPRGSLGPREYFIPGTRLPPPTHGPQDYPMPPPTARDSLPSGPREEVPPASPSSVQDHSQASKPSP
ncbi:transport and Golgi organization protein 1 homolog isoform X2 [Peromyscus eremicus]|uniref:transport and Golgi organization protein 1 homolog isoform X2 n=1 Tax=Peromyscus eremicus TaxID=42410 RepID=UPI0027DCB470|nr:transport and Golgi organization protein 1 homolog isoform X2 [Peromyscus eremicus]